CKSSPSVKDSGKLQYLGNLTFTSSRLLRQKYWDGSFPINKSNCNCFPSTVIESESPSLGS
ncbi:MAG: hypothetical protein K2L46_07945, partial [Paramuribaculum sp.]|nr:hypothetical protein [Paramuribaculum sp.]